MMETFCLLSDSNVVDAVRGGDHALERSGEEARTRSAVAPT